jgi:hypothetical protein
MRFFMSLTREDMAALSHLARAACRPPRDQAMWLLSQAIHREVEREARRRRAPKREREVASVAC